MRITIVKDSGTVSVDGEAYVVDLSSLPASFHALQWDGASGELEHAMVFCEHCGTRGKRPNETVSDFTPYMTFMNAWHAAKAQAVLAAQAAQKEAEEKAAQVQAEHHAEA